jgi:undecaprenyl-diphosphatase
MKEEAKHVATKAVHAGTLAARRVGAWGFGVLIALGIAAGGVWIFIELADEVGEGTTHGADRAILLALRNPQDHADPIGAAWFEEAVRDITALGSIAVQALLTAAMIGALLMERKLRSAIFVLIAVGGGLSLNMLLKEFFSRERPDLVAHGMETFTASFPSGHAMSSAITYLTLAALLAQLSAKHRIKAYYVVLGVVATLLVGSSRVYLGVHWPSDVAAGWAAGAAWALLCWAIAVGLQRRGHVEEEDEETPAAVV